MKNRELGSVAVPLAFVLMLALTLVAFMWRSGATNGVAQSKYLVPQGYTGWVHVYFDIEGAPVAERQGDAFIYRVPAHGRLLTSTPHDAGDRSDMRFFYYDGQNETGIDGRDGGSDLIQAVHSSSKGTFTSVPTGEHTATLEPARQTHYDEFFVGTKEQYAAVTGKSPKEYAEIEAAERREFAQEAAKYRTQNSSPTSNDDRPRTDPPRR